MKLLYDTGVTPLINKHYGYTFQPGRYGQVAMRAQPEARTRYPRQFKRMQHQAETRRAWAGLSAGEISNWNTFAATYPQACKNPDSGFLTGYQNFLKRQYYQFLNYSPTGDIITSPGLTEIFIDPCTYEIRSTGYELFVDYEFTNWLNDNIVSLYCSYPKSAGRLYQKTQTRYVGFIKNLLPVIINYGSMYNWYAANDSRNICSSGWHVPTKTEILSIFSYYDSSPIGEYYTSGRQLKESGTSHWNSPNEDYANNASGLTLRGGGERDQYIGEFYGLKDYSNWWLSSVESGYYGDGFYCDKDSQYINCVFLIADSDKQAGWYVRPVKDSTTLTHGQIGTYIGNDGKSYPTIAIGSPAIEIVAANIVETQFQNGDFIDGYNSTFTDMEWSELSSAAMCNYNNDISLAYSNASTPLSLNITELYQYNFGLIPEPGKHLLFKAVPMAIDNGQFFEKTLDLYEIL